MEVSNMITHFHTPEYEFLSNFFELRPDHYIKMRNPKTGASLSYRTSEHAFQAAKTLDDSQRLQIQRAAFAGVAKKMGSKTGYRGFVLALRPDWDANLKLQVMEALLRVKFRDPLLREKLLATDDKELQEGNWWGDDFWGVVISKAGQPCNPYGENHLGKLLMKIREEVRHALAPRA